MKWTSEELVFHLANYTIGTLPAGIQSALMEFYAEHGEPHWKGKEVRCRVWWTRPKGQIVNCQIIQTPNRAYNRRAGSFPSYEVRPLTGNTHIRYVSENYVEGCKGWDQNE